MGSNRAYREEAPERRVQVPSFYISTHEITNDQFSLFVDETGYKTVAEQVPDLSQFPNAPDELKLPGSVVFSPEAFSKLRTQLSWWTYVPGANWNAPKGPGSSVEGIGNHPVVHIAHADAIAYASWVGGRLPTEAEWEYAARGLNENTVYAWGEDFTPNGQHQANTWQGPFPVANTNDDGFSGSAPVGCYTPNGFGLYDMIGNVWEWTADPYAPQSTQFGTIKGGSYLCSSSFCARFRPSARHSQERTLGTSHIGFRVVWDWSAPEKLAHSLREDRL